MIIIIFARSLGDDGELRLYSPEHGALHFYCFSRACSVVFIICLRRQEHFQLPTAPRRHLPASSARWSIVVRSLLLRLKSLHWRRLGRGEMLLLHRLARSRVQEMQEWAYELLERTRLKLALLLAWRIFYECDQTILASGGEGMCRLVHWRFLVKEPAHVLARPRPSMISSLRSCCRLCRQRRLAGGHRCENCSRRVPPLFIVSHTKS